MNSKIVCFALFHLAISSIAFGQYDENAVRGVFEQGGDERNVVGQMGGAVDFVVTGSETNDNLRIENGNSSTFFFHSLYVFANLDLSGFSIVRTRPVERFSGGRIRVYLRIQPAPANLNQGRVLLMRSGSNSLIDGDRINLQ